MGNKLFPKEIIENSSEANFSKHSLQTKLIYMGVIAVLAAVLFSLPFINVTVSVSSQGLIKPLTHRNKLVSLVSGNIEELYIKENTHVKKGQTVAKISSSVLHEQQQFNVHRQQKIRQYLSDLNLLLRLDSSQMLSSLGSNSNIDTALSSSLMRYKEQVINVIQDIKQSSSSEKPAYFFSNNKGNIFLENARIKLWELLHTQSSSLLNNQGRKQSSFKKEVIKQFKERISPSLQEIEKNRTRLSRHELLNSKGIISDSTYQASQSSLNGSWNELITYLNNEALSILNVSSPKKKSEQNSDNNRESIDLKTPKFKSSLLEFKQKVRSNVQEIELAQQEFNRNRELYQRNVISEAAYEKISFNLERAKSDFKLLFDQQQNEWQADKISYQNELEQLGADNQQIGEKKEKYVITAPISGTIQNMKGIYEGSSVSPNQALAEISPDTSLIAECYVPPKDIGLLKKGMDVRLQISAFDYNQWGLLSGTVKEISNDVTVVNDQPVFKVRATLDKTWLELPNGYRGKLKKGMNLQARFKITKRTLFQLLYDNVDDWLNPKWDQQNGQPQQAGV